MPGVARVGLAGAGSALTAAEWLLLHAAIAVASAGVAFIFGGGFMAIIGLTLANAAIAVFWR